MSLNQEIFLLIDRYLLGEMTPEEQTAFEEKMQQNEELAEEVEKQQIMLNAMDEHDGFLEEKTESGNTSTHFPSRKKLGKYRQTKRKRILSTLGIAATISIITFISTLVIINRKVIKSKKEKNYMYNALDERILKLESQIESLQPALKKLDSLETVIKKDTTEVDF